VRNQEENRIAFRLKRIFIHSEYTADFKKRVPQDGL
jgi:hypothetical protein